jgi:hypothetical protein
MIECRMEEIAMPTVEIGIRRARDRAWILREVETSRRALPCGFLLSRSLQNRALLG